MPSKKKSEPGFSRRTFLKTVGAGGVAAEHTEAPAERSTGSTDLRSATATTVVPRLDHSSGVRSNTRESPVLLQQLRHRRRECCNRLGTGRYQTHNRHSALSGLTSIDVSDHRLLNRT